MRSFFAALAVFAAVAFWPSGWSTAEPPEDRRLVAAMFYSNFCGSCKVLDPRIQDVKDEFADRPIDFVKFNQTFSIFNTNALRRMAEEHGVAAIFEEYRGATGFMLIVDPDGERILEMITVRYSRDDIRAALKRAIERTDISS